MDLSKVLKYLFLSQLMVPMMTFGFSSFLKQNVLKVHT